jgi:hypothetical protein
MLPYRDSRFTILALAVFFAIAFGYAIFEARGIVLGPTIDVPAGISEVHQAYVLIQGRATRISSLAMNGQQIQVTESGDFAQPYLLAPGYNRILLDAKDSYGRTREKVIEIMYLPNSTSSSTSGQANPSATSTVGTSTPAASSTSPIAPGN